MVGTEQNRVMNGNGRKNIMKNKFTSEDTAKMKNKNHMMVWAHRTMMSRKNNRVYSSQTKMQNRELESKLEEMIQMVGTH